MTAPSGRWDKNHPMYKWVALSNTTMGMLVATINGSIVLISLPAIFRGIHLNPLAPGNVSYLLWMIMGFLLVSAVLVVTLGRLGDMYGRVKVYNLGFLVFFLSSVILAIEPLDGAGGALWIIGWRLVQGIGGAMLFANSTAILTDAFPANQRGTALGVNMVAAIAGSFIGLILGGVLSEWHWRAIFWVSVPFGLIGTIWSYRSLHELGGTTGRSKIDWWGNLTFAVGLSALLAAITYGIQPYGGHSQGWTNPWVLAGLIGGALLLVVFGVHRDHGLRPDVPHGAVPDPAVLGRQPGRPAGLDRPRRHAVHADHLAAGHLAPAARLQLRVDAAVGRDLPVAAEHRLPGRRAGVGLALRPDRGRALATGGLLVTGRPSSR